MSKNREKEAVFWPIQRLVIVHMELPQLSGRGFLDESASNEETSEQILYYFDAGLKFAAGNAPTLSQDALLFPVRYQIPEAVQFVALCTALYNLPASVDSEEDEESKDATEFVYLENSLLVFIPLESCPLVVAMAQVSRAKSTNGEERVGSGGSPLAVKTSIQQSYQLFQLLRGGGIHYRLSNSKDAIYREDDLITESEMSSYPGMVRLYELRKRIRKARDQNKLQDEEKMVPEQQIMDMEQEIEELEMQLPISSLRADLSVHFNDLMEEMTTVATYCTKSVKRCLVDYLPTPVVLMSGSHRILSAPSPPDMELLNQLISSIQHIADTINQDWAPGEPFLLGITTFLSEQLISTNYSLSDGAEQVHCSFEIPMKTAYLLMGYIASYRYKIMIHHHGSHSVPGSPPRFQRLSLPFESTDGPSGDDPESLGRDDLTPTRLGQFLSPPPLSLLSATDCVYDLPGPQGERIWAPRFYLPQHYQSGSNSRISVKEVHVIVYEVKDFTFLLYFMPDAIFSDDSAGPGDGITSLSPSTSYLSPSQQSRKLEAISCRLTESVEHCLLDRKPEPADTSPGDCIVPSPWTTSILEWKESGQDVIFVDRGSNKLLLFSDRLADASDHDKKKAPRSHSRSPTRGFLSRLKGRKQQRSAARDRRTASQQTDGSTIGLDCRHFLASLLPIESLLALDDIMSEAQERRDHGKDDGDKSHWESATFTAHGWIYSRTHGDKELYVLFDSSVYMTVADVQQAAARIRKELFQDEL